MLKLETKTNTTFVDGVLTHSTEDDENIFVSYSKVKNLQKQLDEAEEELINLKKENILESFKNLCVEFKKEFDDYPTVAYMGYWERSYLEQSCYKLWGEYYVHIAGHRIKLKSGCSQGSGEVRLHLVDSAETE